MLIPVHCRTWNRCLHRPAAWRRPGVFARFVPGRLGDRVDPLHVANPEPPCLIPLLAAADPLAIQLMACLDPPEWLLRKTFGLGPATGVGYHACVVQGRGAAQAFVDAHGAQPVAAVERTRIDQGPTEIRLSQIRTIQPCAPEVAAPQRCPFRAAEARSLRRSAPSKRALLRLARRRSAAFRFTSRRSACTRSASASVQFGHDPASRSTIKSSARAESGARAALLATAVGLAWAVGHAGDVIAL